jgi:hypothetical protein
VTQTWREEKDGRGLHREVQVCASHCAEMLMLLLWQDSVVQRQEAILAGSGKEVASLKARIAALDRQTHELQLKSSGPPTPHVIPPPHYHAPKPPPDGHGKLAGRLRFTRRASPANRRPRPRQPGVVAKSLWSADVPLIPF